MAFWVVVLILLGALIPAVIAYGRLNEKVDTIETNFEVIDKLEDRLNNEVFKIKDLLKYWERFTDYNWGTEEDYWSNKDIYCSNKLYDIDNIKYIINETWINNFNRLRKNINNIDIESFSMLLRSTRIKCIIKDNAEIDFLNPMREFDDYWFYKKSKIQYLIDWRVIQWFLFSLLLYILIVYLVYYKFILYMVYWKKK